MDDVQWRAGRRGVGDDLLDAGDAAGVLDETRRAKMNEDRRVMSRADAECVEDLLSRRRRRVVDPHPDA